MNSKIINLSLSILFLFALGFFQSITAQQNETDLYKWLKSIPEFEVKQIKGDDMFSEVYEIMVTMPVDHNNPEGQKFKQQVFLSHVDAEKPLVMYLEGYATDNWTQELTKMLGCNQLVVEHRYFGESVPEPFDWKFLTIKQAADDHHRIVELFKKYYKDKWISTGISKGGSTVIFHARYYPNDIDVCVPYVGPINFSTEDKRVYEWINSVSTPECREKVFNFQKLCLTKREELYPIFLQNAEEKKLTYQIVGSERAYEYAVLEYSFAYWQWSDGDCSKIPDENSPIEEIWKHLLINGGVTYFSDQDIEGIYPFFYQCYTEYGYYGYDISPFGDLIKYADGHTPFFFPMHELPEFDPTVTQDISNWVQNEANNFIFIYGGNDPWSSTGVCLTGKTNSIKIVLPGGSHRTRIKSFTGKDKRLIISKLEEWLGVNLQIGD